MCGLLWYKLGVLLLVSLYQGFLSLIVWCVALFNHPSQFSLKFPVISTFILTFNLPPNTTTSPWHSWFPAWNYIMNWAWRWLALFSLFFRLIKNFFLQSFISFEVVLKCNYFGFALICMLYFGTLFYYWVLILNLSNTTTMVPLDVALDGSTSTIITGEIQHTSK